MSTSELVGYLNRIQTDLKQFCKGGVSCAFLRQRLEGAIFLTKKCGPGISSLPEVIAEAAPFRSLCRGREDSAASAVAYNGVMYPIVAQNNGITTGGSQTWVLT